jgi:hypothetical protein
MDVTGLTPEQVEKAIFNLLCQKYVQRADDRQKSMGLQYTEAETHDLAHTIYRSLVAPLLAKVPESSEVGDGTVH